ncbi:MAG: hypothetical protein LBJ00_17465 [Planctomycetaceae bacterium]|nr:hypothetical protein [Planctomycetaceae bacterium]
MDITVEEGIAFLETLCTVEVQRDGNIPIPEILPAKIKSKPNTKTKLKNVANKSKTKN